MWFRRAGWGNGPLIGSFSTPFARVVQAAVATRKKGSAFAPGNVTPDLIAPELHVIALAQTAATDDGMPLQSTQSWGRFGDGLESLRDLAGPRESTFPNKFHWSPHESAPERASHARGHHRLLTCATRQEPCLSPKPTASSFTRRFPLRAIERPRTLASSRS